MEPENPETQRSRRRPRVQGQFPTNDKPTAMAGRRAYRVQRSASTLPMSLEAGWDVRCIPTHAGVDGGQLRLRDLHRGGPG